jgi:CBS domain-containing protein
MQVSEIMSSPAITVGPEAEIREVARIMRSNQISGLPVVDQAGRLMGLITELDLIARNAPLREPRYIAVLSALIPVNIDEYRHYKEQLRHVLATRAADLIEEDFPTVAPDADIEEALELMLNPATTMLPVVANGQLIGVVTRTDLVRLIERLESAPDDETA